jgi:hypothetical protein
MNPFAAFPNLVRLSLSGAHASGSLHVPVSKVLYGTWGTARAAQWGDYLCSPALGDIMSILTFTDKRLLPGTYTSPGEAKAPARVPI